MKRWLGLCLLALAGLAGSIANGAQPTGSTKVRILLTVGGHAFDEQPFFALFKAMPDVDFTVAHMPKDAGLLKPGLEKQFQAIVMYDMVGTVTPEQQKAFVALLEQGIGVVALHHNIGAHPDWTEFPKIIGGKFFLKPTEFQGKKYAASTWDHDQDLNVTLADPDHPITKGMNAFQIHDETYKGFWTAPSAHVLLKTDHPKNNAELAWTGQYGKSRVFYLMLGHDRKAYANPAYGQLIHRGILWTTGR